MLDYPKNQLTDLYKSLPVELQKAIFSADNGDKIIDICERNGIKDDKTMSKIAKYSGYVMIGVLPPDDLQKTFEKETSLSKETAKQIAWEISRFIFLPVKQYIEALYGADLAKTFSEKNGAAKTFSAPAKETLKPPPRKKTSDAYREPIE